MKILFTFFVLIISVFATSVVIASDLPKFDPPPDEVVYRGVTEEQWETISRIGDPLNCRQRVYDLQNLNLDEFYELKPKDCKSPRCIADALSKNNKVILREGIYESFSISMGNKFLIGHPDERIIINIISKTGVTMNNSVLSNIIIQNAGDIGISVKNDNLIYKVVVGNTGIHNKSSRRGHGFRLGERSAAANTCIVSADAYNSFNYKSKYYHGRVGGSADGFSLKFSSAKNITFIDSHGYHNSDHGFDFFCSANKEKIPVARMYYSSAIHGRNPIKFGGDYGGIKIGGHHNEPECNRKDERTTPRIMYATIACFNQLNIENGNNVKVKKINSNNDSFKLQCKDFAYIKKMKERSFDIMPGYEGEINPAVELDINTYSDDDVCTFSLNINKFKNHENKWVKEANKRELSLDRCIELVNAKKDLKENNNLQVCIGATRNDTWRSEDNRWVVEAKIRSLSLEDCNNIILDEIKKDEKDKEEMSNFLNDLEERMNKVWSD